MSVSCWLGTIVLLHNSILAHLKLLDRWPDICLKNIIKWNLSVSTTANFPGPVAANQPKLITPSPP